MKKYKCWYGLGGGFGGARDFEIEEFDNENINDDYLFLEDKIDTSNINFQNGQKNMF